MSADLRSAVIDIGIILKSAAGRSQPHRLEKRPNRDVVQVGRNANSRAMLRRGSRAYTDFMAWRQRFLVEDVVCPLNRESAAVGSGFQSGRIGYPADKALFGSRALRDPK